jgi:hypothetical protein
MNSQACRPVVAAVCGDAGGAAALLPVLQHLNEQNQVIIHAFAYTHGERMLRTAGFTVESIPVDASASWIKERLTATNARLLLAATSDNGLDHERRFVAGARQCGIQSLGVLDFWSNYARRFATTEHPLGALPDILAVMDDHAMQGLQAAGIPASVIRVTGHPGFDTLSMRRAAFSAADAKVLRHRIGTPDEALLILFVSQPFEHGASVSILDAETLGFTANQVQTAVIAAARNIASRRRVPVHLVIRPHPRERLTVRSEAAPLLTVSVVSDTDRHDTVLASDLVVGMNSMLLVEACILGRPVLSVQPEIKIKDPLPTNAQGRSRPVYRWDEVEASLELLLFDDLTRSALIHRNITQEQFGGATARVVAHSRSLMSTNTHVLSAP